MWLKEGDLNTSFFFHKVASGKHRSSLISLSMLTLSDNVSASILRCAVIEPFKQRFSGGGNLHIQEWSVEFPTLGPSTALSLKNPFSEVEDFRVLKESDGNKASGPDGFHYKFAQSYWQVFKEEMMTLF